MIAVKESAMNPHDFAAVEEVDQTTTLRLAHKRDLPGTCGSSRWRFQGPDKQSRSPAPSFSPKGLGLTPYPGFQQADLREANKNLVTFIDPNALTITRIAAAKQIPDFKIGDSLRLWQDDIGSCFQRQTAQKSNQ